MNALDNRVARNHVNRMCLAANVPLVETGTAGYAGQVKNFNIHLIKTKVTKKAICNKEKNRFIYFTYFLIQVYFISLKNCYRWN